MPTDNLYTGLMAEVCDYLAEVLDDAEYPAAVDYFAEKNPDIPLRQPTIAKEEQLA